MRLWITAPFMESVLALAAESLGAHAGGGLYSKHDATFSIQASWYPFHWLQKHPRQLFPTASIPTYPLAQLNIRSATLSHYETAQSWGRQGGKDKGCHKPPPPKIFVLFLPCTRFSVSLPTNTRVTPQEWRDRPLQVSFYITHLPQPVRRHTAAEAHRVLASMNCSNIDLKLVPSDFWCPYSQDGILESLWSKPYKFLKLELWCQYSNFSPTEKSASTMMARPRVAIDSQRQVDSCDRLPSTVALAELLGFSNVECKRVV